MGKPQSKPSTMLARSTRAIAENQARVTLWVKQLECIKTTAEFRTHKRTEISSAGEEAKETG